MADPNGIPFYVGKGTADRIDFHEKETAKGVSSKKCNKIREIVRAGHILAKRKIASFKEEQDAYAFERQLIEEYGTATLTNIARPYIPERDPVRRKLKNPSYQRLLAIGIRMKLGKYRAPQGVWTAALVRAFTSHWEKMWAEAKVKLRYEELRDGLRPWGIDYGR